MKPHLFILRVVVLILLMVLLGGLALASPSRLAPLQQIPRNKDVSIIQLIANPEKFDGKPVLVTGFVHVEFEGTGVYLNKEDYRHGIEKNGPAIGVEQGGKFVISKKKYASKYCSIAGTFRANPNGSSSLWSGSISVQEMW